MWTFPENPHRARPNFETVHMETQARESMEIPPSFSTEAEAAVLGSRKSCLTTPGCVCTWALHRRRALLCLPPASSGFAGQKDSICSPVLRGGAQVLLKACQDALWKEFIRTCKALGPWGQTNVTAGHVWEHWGAVAVGKETRGETGRKKQGKLNENVATFKVKHGVQGGRGCPLKGDVLPGKVIKQQTNKNKITTTSLQQHSCWFIQRSFKDALVSPHILINKQTNKQINTYI